MAGRTSNVQRPSPIVVPRQQKQKQRKETLTRQSSNISNEGYHSESVSVPFVWESQPGTPKVRFRENSLPPLTPPPSYLYKNAAKKPAIKSKNNKNSSNKSSFLQSIFTKRSARKGNCVDPQAGAFQSCNSSSSSSSSLSVSSPRRMSCSVPSSPMIYTRKGEEEEEEDLYHVSRSSLCFGNARSRGCYSSMFKKVLLGDFL